MSAQPIGSTDELLAAFGAHHTEYTLFSRVAQPRSSRPDLHAFLLLNELVPDTKDIVSAAGHDEIWLSPSLDDLVAAGITEDQVIELARCGVRISEDSLSMYA